MAICITLVVSVLATRSLVYGRDTRKQFVFCLEVYSNKYVDMYS